MEVVAIALVIIVAFNLGIVFWVYKITSHYNSLTKGLDKKTLMSVLEGIQKTLASHERSISSTKKELIAIKDDSKFQLRHLIFKRFNPFSDTGGDQSFMLAIMDGNRDGVVITSLHSRENTRFYVKSVESGEGLEHPLSREEQKLISNKE